MPTTNINLGFVAAAAGTVDVITATYSPVPAALTDKMLVWFRASGANTSTTPTFSPNGLTARTIVKNGGQALVAGDIPAAGAIVGLVYDLANTRWEIIGYFEQGGWVKVGTNVILKTITDNVGIGTATPVTKLDVNGDFHQIQTGVNNSTEVSSGSNAFSITTDQSGAGNGIGQFILNAGAGGIAALQWTDGSSNVMGFYATKNGKAYIGAATGLADESTFVVLLNGNIGMGIAAPTEKLHVVGKAIITKGLVPRVQSVASAATVTPDADGNDLVKVTAQAEALTLAAPSGTPTEGQAMMIRLKDNGTARAITYNAIYRAVGVTAPTTTVINKTTYLGMVYNDTDTKWDIIGVSTEA